MDQKGFTLIELMIVVAIVGILVAVGVFPMYKDYTIKSRVTEGLEMASSAKMAVSESTSVHNILPASQAVTGYVTPAATNNVASIVIFGGGVIMITFTPLAGNGTLILTPVLSANGDLRWDCTGGSLPVKYRPASCRP